MFKSVFLASSIKARLGMANKNEVVISLRRGSQEREEECWGRSEEAGALFKESFRKLKHQRKYDVIDRLRGMKLALKIKRKCKVEKKYFLPHMRK